MSAPDTDPLIGTVFDGRYRILRRIGRGGMGSVYEAEQGGLKRRVALKVVRSDAAEDLDAAARFVREAKIASRLSHENTIRMFDFGHSKAGLYMAMELLQGQTLSERLRDSSRLHPREAAAIASGIARSLGEAHAYGIVHRDLKPANVFLHRQFGGEQVVKVLDFGIAKFTHDELTRSHGATVFQTAADQVLGTLPYLSPEQIEARPVDGRSDLYALGVLCFRMLSGDLPFKSDNALDVVRMHLRMAPPELPESTPAPFRELVRRLLAKEQTQRPADSVEVIKVLDSLTGGFRLGHSVPDGAGTGRGVMPIQKPTPAREDGVPGRAPNVELHEQRTVAVDREARRPMEPAARQTPPKKEELDERTRLIEERLLEPLKPPRRDPFGPAIVLILVAAALVWLVINGAV